ncbi:hypothetical protein F5Y10DRAFT_158748 [Nemania abortiva]|nr:hypothetical protein F5Y10DRAFT_158748 [Nemania abortiva]
MQANAELVSHVSVKFSSQLTGTMMLLLGCLAAIETCAAVTFATSRDSGCCGGIKSNEFAGFCQPPCFMLRPLVVQLSRDSGRTTCHAVSAVEALITVIDIASDPRTM